MSLPRWSADEMDEAIATGEAVLVDLRAEWCPQCGPQEQVLERLLPSFAGRVRFGSLDVQEYPEVAAAYEVQGLPALLLFRGGGHRETLRGFKRAPLVQQSVEAMLAEAESA